MSTSTLLLIFIWNNVILKDEYFDESNFICLLGYLQSHHIDITEKHQENEICAPRTRRKLNDSPSSPCVFVLPQNNSNTPLVDKMLEFYGLTEPFLNTKIMDCSVGSGLVPFQ